MKKKSYIYMFCATALLAFSSCKDEEWNQGLNGGKQGELDLTDLKLDVSEIEKVIKVDARSRDVNPSSYDINSFIVKITDKETGAAINTWTYANTPEIVSLNPGAYTVTVYSHEQQAAEWEKPYFHVDKDVSIVANAVERLGILTAKLANSAVSIIIDEELKKYCADDVQVEVVANNEGRLVYGKNETRKGYFRIVDGSSTMVVTFSGTVNGYKEYVELPQTDLQAGQHRIYTFRAKTNTNPVPDENGNVDPGSGVGIDVSVSDEDVDGDVTLEEDYEVIDPSDRPGYEDPENPGIDDPKDPTEPDNPDDPGEEAATFSPCEGLSLTEVNNYNNYGEDLNPCVLTINCPAGFAHINVEINSKYLTESFMNSILLSTNFDLAEPGSYEGGLNDLGFVTGNDVKGKTSVDFNITTLAPMLAIGEGDGISPSEIHEFHIQAVDVNGKSASCTLRFTGNN